ncbi:hypothetical protein KJZ24_15175 [Enterococcus faecalis]|uniref:hypothetical protein n=1 Tax=Enterococcus faecalis TaxID=1351 RepID=UPI0019244C0D|nr:hypothetical protein [Enterococcus faecalis]HAZ1125486.1 hypothetical protein [Enterococcus faecium]MCE2535553.1 hypothetical protein [Enterococcus faecalis]MCE2553301.1 hypothetical protein [Enterococcus faecalis]MCE2556597.1 hypothetical protein [Enterococcus faecalis]QWW18557.1 hypothetical protein KKP64_17175 [Enterococcus faecalis]
MNPKSLANLQKWCNENLLNRTEAMAITNQSYAAFAQSVYTKQLVPFIEKKGETPAGTVKLYLKADVEAYAEKIKRRQINQPKKHK